FMVNIYGPQDPPAKATLWSSLLYFSQHHQGRYVLFGDLNEVRDEHERLGMNFSKSEAQVFNKFVVDSGLLEMVMGGKSFTWMNKLGTKMSKLDLVSSIGRDTYHSTSGYCVFLGNKLLSWSSKHLPTLSRSSAEAEYRGVANAVAETCWLRNLLRELHTHLSSATLVYCHNISAVYLSYNPVQHQPTKHIEIDIHFIRDLVPAGQVRVLHVPSRYQFADIFIKRLPSALFEEFRSSLSVWCPTALTVGEC
nr:ribonuclease H-like domain-containing protein [Tanacetum cinerariifolium]